jgi:hypothetical protein
MPAMSPTRDRAGQGRPSSAGARAGDRGYESDQISSARRWAVRVLLGAVVLGETALLLIALVPQTVWAAHNLPDGPVPHKLYPLVAAAFYALPSVTGALCRRWQVAVVLATLPAWLDLGAFAAVAAAAGHIGPFYLAQEPHSTSAVGTLELFAALGALGWLARTVVLALLGRGEWSGR